MPRRRYHWIRDANGRFAISREQPAAEQSDQTPPNADGGAGRGDAPPQPVDMNELIRGGAFNFNRRWP
jgi:hypothetical protein